MTHPDDDALAALALGEPAAGVAEHVRGCPSCSDALASTRDAITTLRAPVPGLVAPPASVWDAVEAEIDRTPEQAATGTVAAGTDSGSGVDPSNHLALQRPGRAAASGRRRVIAAWVAGAAAAGIVIGVVGARAVDDDQGGAGVTVASTSLDTLDTGQAKGTADVVRQDGRFDLEVSTQPIDPDGGYLEVWLINQDLKRMVSVGVLEPEQADQSFAIPQDLLDQGYVIVDISREGFDDAPGHSGDSVVRGTLAT